MGPFEIIVKKGALYTKQVIEKILNTQYNNHGTVITCKITEK